MPSRWSDGFLRPARLHPAGEHPGYRPMRPIRARAAPVARPLFRNHDQAGGCESRHRYADKPDADGANPHQLGIAPQRSA